MNWGMVSVAGEGDGLGRGMWVLERYVLGDKVGSGTFSDIFACECWEGAEGMRERMGWVGVFGDGFGEDLVGDSGDRGRLEGMGEGERERVLEERRGKRRAMHEAMDAWAAEQRRREAGGAAGGAAGHAAAFVVKVERPGDGRGEGGHAVGAVLPKESRILLMLQGSGHVCRYVAAGHAGGGAVETSAGDGVDLLAQYEQEREEKRRESMEHGHGHGHGGGGRKRRSSLDAGRATATDRLPDPFVLVMERLGLDLSALRRREGDRHGTFSCHTACALGAQMLSAVREVHAAGFVHRDVKPNNFCVGRGGGSRRVYVLDFGLCKRWRDPDTQAHLPGRESGCGFRGSRVFASPNMHRGCEAGRRDDLWSLLYALVEFLEGTLPWRTLTGPHGHSTGGAHGALTGDGSSGEGDAKDRVAALKQACLSDFDSIFCGGGSGRRSAPPEAREGLRAFCAALSAMGHEDEPDYAHLEGLLRGIHAAVYPGTAERVSAGAPLEELMPLDWEAGAASAQARAQTWSDPGVDPAAAAAEPPVNRQYDHGGLPPGDPQGQHQAWMERQPTRPRGEGYPHGDGDGGGEHAYPAAPRAEAESKQQQGGEAPAPKPQKRPKVNGMGMCFDLLLQGVCMKQGKRKCSHEHGGGMTDVRHLWPAGAQAPIKILCTKHELGNCQPRCTTGRYHLTTEERDYFRVSGRLPLVAFGLGQNRAPPRGPPPPSGGHPVPGYPPQGAHRDAGPPADPYRQPPPGYGPPPPPPGYDAPPHPYGPPPPPSYSVAPPGYDRDYDRDYYDRGYDRGYERPPPGYDAPPPGYGAPPQKPQPPLPGYEREHLRDYEQRGYSRTAPPPMVRPGGYGPPPPGYPDAVPPPAGYPDAVPPPRAPHPPPLEPPLPRTASAPAKASGFSSAALKEAARERAAEEARKRSAAEVPVVPAPYTPGMYAPVNLGARPNPKANPGGGAPLQRARSAERPASSGAPLPPGFEGGPPTKAPPPKRSRVAPPPSDWD